MADLELTDIDEKTLGRFIKIVHQVTGITLNPNRKTMLQGRLRQRMRELHLESFFDYLAYFESHPEEKQLFINAVTTNETYFYRTPRIWDFIDTELLHVWYRDHPGDTFYAWSAASSSGEEAYTLGVFLQHFKLTHPNFKYEISATDISRHVLDIAERGLYTGRAIDSFRKMQPLLFKRYMKEGANGFYSVLPEIRKQIQFQSHNLFERPKFAHMFDLVLARNVLIYFEPDDQEKVLASISSRMKKGASLIIGESESLNSLKTEFQYVKPLIYTFQGLASSTGNAGSAHGAVA